MDDIENIKALKRGGKQLQWPAATTKETPAQRKWSEFRMTE